MTCKSKEQRWQEMYTRVAHMKDKLGKEVDAGIADVDTILKGRKESCQKKNTNSYCTFSKY
jgi:hypothetical protein